jgi:hypothetical protein
MINKDLELVLNWLGFTSEEIVYVDTAIMASNGSLVSPSTIVKKYIDYFGINPYLNSYKLAYLCELLISQKSDVLDSASLLMTGRDIEYEGSYRGSDTERAVRSLSSHYLRMNKHFNSMNTVFKGYQNLVKANKDLPPSNLTGITELAEVSGIENEMFSIYNSDRYEDSSRYMVVKRKGERVQLVPNRLPLVNYGESLSADGVGELREDSISDFGNKTYTLYLNSRYVKLLNTFVICVSTRMPDSHLGMFEIPCLSGSRVFVYATEWTRKGRVLRKRNTEFNTNTARIIDFGYTTNQLENKLKKAYNLLSKKFGITAIVKQPVYVAPSQPYNQNKRISLTSNTEQERDLDFENIDFSIG